MEQFLETHNLPEHTQREIQCELTYSYNEIESIVNNLPKQKAPDADCFPGDFYQIF